MKKVAVAPRPVDPYRNFQTLIYSQVIARGFMPKANVGIDSGGQIGRISFEEQNVQAHGGPEFPKLMFLLDLRLSPLKPYSPPENPVYPLTWMFLSGDLCSPEQRVVAKFRDEVNLYADANHSPETQFWLEIPLDLITIERIEQSREGDLRAAINFRAFFAVHISGGTGVQRFETTRIDPITFTIPKSQWVEKLLPQLGHGKVELIEVRIPSGSRADGLPKAVQEIRQARAYLLNGDWEKAVAHCRNTLETILDSPQIQVAPTSPFRLKVDTFIEQHLSPKLPGKQSKLLAEEMKLLWEICSTAAHPSPQTFSRADANFIVQNTTDILVYVSGLL